MLLGSQAQRKGVGLDLFSLVTGTPITLGNMSLAKRIRASRLGAGLSQSELSRRIGVAPSAVNHMESGRTAALKAETLLSIAAALSVSAYWLETGHGSPSADARLTPEETELLSIYRALSAGNKDAWLTVGRTLRHAQPGESKSGLPFPYPPHRAKP